MSRQAEKVGRALFGRGASPGWAMARPPVRAPWRWKCGYRLLPDWAPFCALSGLPHQDEGPQRRQRQLYGIGPTMPGDLFRGHTTAIADIAATIEEGVGIDLFGVVPGHGDADPAVRPGYR